MKRLLAVILAFSVNAYGAAVIPNIFATQPSGNVPASYLDVDFALISNYNTFSNYLVDSGAANAYVVTFPAGTTGSLAAGLLVNFKAGADNTGASTLAANGMTAKSITNYDASALAAGQIKAGAIVSVIYDGTQFKLAGQPGGVWYGNINGNAATATTAGTVTTAAQPNITSVGTLTGLTVDKGSAGNYGTLGHSTKWYLFDDVSNATLMSGTNGTGQGLYVTSSAASLMAASTAVVTATAGAANISGTLSVGTNLVISNTAPTIASGFGTSPSIVANNTAAFQVTVGSGGTATAGTITMPTAPNGWACNANYTAVQSLGYIEQTNVISATQFSIANIHATTGLAVAWPAGTTIQVQCAAF